MRSVSRALLDESAFTIVMCALVGGRNRPLVQLPAPSRLSPTPLAFQLLAAGCLSRRIDDAYRFCSDSEQTNSQRDCSINIESTFAALERAREKKPRNSACLCDYRCCAMPNAELMWLSPRPHRHRRW